MTDDLESDANGFNDAAASGFTEAGTYYDSLGPWVPQAVVRDGLGVTDEALAVMRSRHRILAVEFSGQYYYPLSQFKAGGVVEGLEAVLVALSRGFQSPEAQAGWFAEAAFEGSPETRWQALRSGSEMVVQWARDDAAASSGEHESVDPPKPAPRHVIRLSDTDSILMARSEARRVLSTASGFEEVGVDFAGVEQVGQGFADEMFRVWPSQNPGVHVIPINMNEAVDFMVRRALAG